MPLDERVNCAPIHPKSGGLLILHHLVLPTQLMHLPLEEARRGDTPPTPALPTLCTLSSVTPPTKKKYASRKLATVWQDWKEKTKSSTYLDAKKLAALAEARGNLIEDPKRIRITHALCFPVPPPAERTALALSRDPASTFQSSKCILAYVCLCLRVGGPRLPAR